MLPSIQFLSVLLAAVVASPVVTKLSSPGNTARSLSFEKRAALLRRTTYLANATLVACEAAPNCETYEDPIFGTRIRFAQGMGPGTEHYAREVLAKRDGDGSGTTTHITVGDDTINYGSKGAGTNSGVIYRIYDRCHEGSCDTNPYGVSSTYAGETIQYDDTVYLHASGQYNGWEQRNGFIDSIVTVAGKGEECWTQTWGNGGGYYGTPQIGSVRMCKQTNYIAFNRFVNGNLQGFVEVRAELKDDGSNWCSTILGALSGITGIIAAVPGLELSGGASGFFGLLNVFCG